MCQFIAVVRPALGRKNNGWVENGEGGGALDIVTLLKGWTMRACLKLNVNRVHGMCRFMVTRYYDGH